MIIFRRILFAVLFLLFFLILELNKNTVPGWIFTGVLFAAVVILFESGLLKSSVLLRLGGWALLIGGFAAVLLLTWPPVRRVPASPDPDPQKTEAVQLKDGKVSGVCLDDGQVELYAAIPYAAPPVGDLRWAPPADPEPWDGVRETSSFAPMSMQTVKQPMVDSLTQLIGFHDYRWFDFSDSCVPEASEDSLYVNVWKPAGEKTGLPVLVYIHGGSLQTGQTWYADYSGEGLAKQDVIVVNFGYRLGVFGFLALPELQEETADGGRTTGNYGLLDQIKALEWVRDNISAFGGDPDNVTLAGESAGAACVSALCTSPLAKGLFRRVILESSTVASPAPPHSFRSLEDAFASGRKVMEACGAESLAELRALPAEKLVSFLETEHHITVDGYVLTETPFESYRKGIHNEEAILHGCNSKESGPFLLFSRTDAKSFPSLVKNALGAEADSVLNVYPASTNAEANESWAEIYGSVFFDYSHDCLTRLAMENGIPVYAYRFSRQNGRIGSWHGGEMVYAFGNVTETSRLYDETDVLLSKQMSACWKAFAETGDPNPPGTDVGMPRWEPVSDTSERMEFGESVGLSRESDRKRVLFDALDRIQGFEKTAGTADGGAE
ncbi:MAG: carboxylesterase family protein [Clostridia bacterium]|nr:carboxylesterase family protein [Clostridia bacterium]